MTNAVVDPRLVVKESLEQAKKAEIASQEREERTKLSLLHRNIRKLLAMYGISAMVANRIIEAKVVIEKKNHGYNSHYFTFGEYVVESALKAWARKKTNSVHPSEARYGHRIENHNPADLTYRYGTFDCQVCIVGMLLKQWMFSEGKIAHCRRRSYDKWLEGYIRKGGKPTHAFPDKNTENFTSDEGELLLAQTNFTLIPLKEKMAIVVPEGIQPQSLENIGPETTLLFMDGFKIKGKRWVPTFANSLQPEKLQEPEEAKTHLEPRVPKHLWPFGSRKK